MANKPLNTELFDKATAFALKAHGGTERRGKAFPYIVHPMEAAAIVATITNDPEILAAAVLHDVVEDSDVTIEEIRRLFGSRIADLVASETDPVISGMDGAESWKARKRFAIDRLSKASLDAKIVAMGDKLSNMRAIYRDYKNIGDELWSIFRVSDPSLHEWHYRGLLAAFTGLEETFAYKEFADLVKGVWG